MTEHTTDESVMSRIQRLLLGIFPALTALMVAAGADQSRDTAPTTSPTDTIVTFTLSRAGSETRLRLIHSGFVLPKNEAAFKNMGDGWKKVVPAIGAIAAEQAPSKKPH